MSDLNEEFLNDDDGDCPDVNDIDEEALLQDDEDVLNLIPEEDEAINESVEESSNTVEQENIRNERLKFSNERQKITAPDPPIANNQGRERGTQSYRRRGGGPNYGRKFYNRNQHGKNKTVLINPRFQGIVHVNNNARLAWDRASNVNPWHSGNAGNLSNMGSSMQPPSNIPMQNMSDPHGNAVVAGHHLQFVPPQQQTFIPVGVHQQAPMQNIQVPPYWDGSNNQYTPVQVPNQWSYLQPPQVEKMVPNNYQTPSPIIINTSQPPPPLPQSNMYQQPVDQYRIQPTLNVVPPHNPNIQNNSFNMNTNRMRNYNQAPKFKPMKRKIGDNFSFASKKLVHERLGVVKPPQRNIKVLKVEDRVPVVREVKVTNVTTVKIEDDDQTRDLRLKIEEQKRKREAILQWKEKRRLENLREAASQNEPQTIPKVENVKVSFNQQEFKPKIPLIQSIQNRGVKKHMKSGNNIIITNGYSRKFTKYQKNSMNNRVPITKTVEQPVNVKQEPDLQLDEKHLSSFLADRKILAKDETLMSTRKVVIKNISTSTRNNKIFQICKSIGEVQVSNRDYR